MRVLRLILLRGALAFALLGCFWSSALAAEARTVNGTPARFRGGLKIPELTSTQITNMGTPSSGFVLLYFKSDGLLYIKDDAGTETQISAAGLEDIAELADPNADRFLFWDDSAGAYAFLVPSTGLTISGTNLTIDSTVATLTGSQVLTNKTLTAPVISSISNTGTITLATVNTTEPTANPAVSGQALVATTAGVQSYAERMACLATNTTESSVTGDLGATVYTFTGQGSSTIPADKFNNIGRSITVFIGGDVTTDGSESETLQHTFKLAAQTILASTAADFSTATTNGAWFACITLTATDVTVPAAAKVQASGYYCVDPGAKGAGLIEPISALLTVDTTGTLLVSATATWANGDASPDVANMDTLTILDGDVS